MPVNINDEISQVTAERYLVSQNSVVRGVFEARNGGSLLVGGSCI
ncbi:hypothetical protein [Acaryochloris sp. 'Moss Beach']|nr:hypothetical protein [Acaryochloris sp. 'Moss Beach']